VQIGGIVVAWSFLVAFGAALAAYLVFEYLKGHPLLRNLAFAGCSLVVLGALAYAIKGVVGETETSEQTSTPTQIRTPSPTASPPTPTISPSPTPGPNPPTPVTFNSGDLFVPDPAWPWVCTGDFDRDIGGGNVENLHDTDSTTGAVLIIPKGSSFRLFAGNQGHCSAASSPDSLLLLASEKENEMFGDKNCDGSGCIRLQILTLDTSGQVTDEATKP
jgi:hypothetical protein